MVAPASAVASNGFGLDGRTVVDEADGPLVDATLDVSSGTPGRIILATDQSVLRLLPDGTLDPSFGADGVVDVPPTPGQSARMIQQLVVAPDGSVIVLGGSSAPGGINSLFRIELSGTDGGFVGEAVTMSGSSTLTQLDAAYLSGGVEASMYVAGGPFLPGSFLTFRSPDAASRSSQPFSFGPPSAGFPGSTQERGVALVPASDGGVFAIGPNHQVPFNGNPCPPAGCGQRFGLTKFNPNSTRDAAFADDGYVSFFTGSTKSVVRTAAGQSFATGEGVLFAGVIDSDLAAAGIQPQTTLARMLPDGSLDATFDGDGVSITSAELDPRAVGSDAGGGAVVGYTEADAFRLDRYDVSGALDLGYGAGGSAAIAFDEGAADLDRLLVDGEAIIVAGVAGEPAKPALARLELDGSLATAPEPSPPPSPGPSDPADPAGELSFEVLDERLPRSVSRLLARGASATIECTADCTVKLRIKARGRSARRLGIAGTIAKGSRELYGREPGQVDAFLFSQVASKLTGSADPPNRLKVAARYEVEPRGT